MNLNKFKNIDFKLVSPFQPAGDQPMAIEQITTAFSNGSRNQVLLGVTGSGKTFTMANIIQQFGRPTLVLSHNKTLAAQLYAELKSFFPDNAVEYFISYYDYYQPEAYVAATDTYIEKTTALNAEIEKLRLRATAALMQRKDVILVASVSCIYGLGSPSDYRDLSIQLSRGEVLDRKKFFQGLVEIQYVRNKYDLTSGSFRVKGDIIDIYPAYEETGIRLETFGDEIEKISIINYLTGQLVEEVESIGIFPAKHFVVTKPKLEESFTLIENELKERVEYFKSEGKLIEAQRIEQRTKMDLEFLKEMGMCQGIENYSRHLSGRAEGERPYCLLDFLPPDFLMILDESHVTVPQIRGMYRGDRARKTTLVDYGFRLPSALDNRPLQFNEFEAISKYSLFVSATPSVYELELCGGEVAEQLIRPTGILDPVTEIKPVKNQIDDLMEQIRVVKERGERILVTTLTKKMAEDLTTYLTSHGVLARYMHSEVETLERVAIIRDLRLGKFDVLVGINLLREGLDLPEVSLVAILDADREGFLRDRRSLLQTSGRAARNVNSKVIFYADRVTESMRLCIEETERRRKIQSEYNTLHGIIPKTVYKSKEEILKQTYINDTKLADLVADESSAYDETVLNAEAKIKKLTDKMKKAATELNFELAAQYRDQIAELQKKL